MFKSKYRIGRKKRQEIAEYYVYENSTIRKTAAHFGIPKSYVHRALADFRCDRYTRDTELAKKVTELVEKNVTERSTRGGQSTKAKYGKKKNG